MNYVFMFRTKKIDYAEIKLSRGKKVDFKGFFRGFRKRNAGCGKGKAQVVWGG